jgi:lipopolysaccharide/colanic/teichoic acid biosynthesis glycosyltransferase
MPKFAGAMKTFESIEPVAAQREGDVLDEQMFHRAIVLERKRTERSGKPFLLMLVEAGNCTSAQKRSKLLSAILSPLMLSTRETDAVGWYGKDLTIGVLFPDIATDDKTSVSAVMQERMSKVLRAHLNSEQLGQIAVSFHLFPEDWEHGGDEPANNPVLYPDLLERAHASKMPRVIKRGIDVLGSCFALLLFSPIFILVAIAIKLTSEGPVLFKQKRVGQYGAMFTFLKFRSMHLNNDATIHLEYVKQLIAGEAVSDSNENGDCVYKITNDPRITAVGRLLRHTSLDEVPQFINVLRGEMSLVGPRPPLPYEVEEYDVWHRRRILEAKPGITGLWQVNGRSRVKFDDMVRLDLLYARTWSLWLDVKILAKTPLAVFQGAH